MAVSLPMPDEAPVTKTVRPAMPPASCRAGVVIDASLLLVCPIVNDERAEAPLGDAEWVCVGRGWAARGALTVSVATN